MKLMKKKRIKLIMIETYRRSNPRPKKLQKIDLNEFIQKLNKNKNPKF